MWILLSLKASELYYDKLLGLIISSKSYFREFVSSLVGVCDFKLYLFTVVACTTCK